MTKYTCLDCKNYCPRKTFLDGLKQTSDGIYEPKEIVVEHHCSKHPKIFIKWWKENHMKCRKDIEYVPNCLDLNDNLVKLDNLINLAQNILDKLHK